MSRASHRLWYFEAHLADNCRVAVGFKGEVVTGDAVLDSAYVGTEAQAHEEADRRCAAYDDSHFPLARAMSFSPVSTLVPKSSPQP